MTDGKQCTYIKTLCKDKVCDLQQYCRQTEDKFTPNVDTILLNTMVIWHPLFELMPIIKT